MKRFFVSFILYTCALFGTQPSLITPDLKELLKVMEVEQDGTAQSIVKATQKAWLRPVGKERWHIQDNLTPIQKKAVMDYGAKAGFFNEIKPLYFDYDYAVILGATTSRIKKRLDLLVKMSEQGVRFKKVILLSGERPLDPSGESIHEGCKTEGDTLEYLWRANPLSKKVAWKHFKHPMISTPSGIRRPTTIDTYRLWLASNPPPGRILAVSNQPYCLLQQLVAQNIMPKGFTYETVGEAPELSSINAQTLLDTVARCLYESARAA